MADIELVIKIPEGLKNDFENENWTALSCMEMKNALEKATPLPIGYGDIVDIKELINMFWDGNSMEITRYDLSVIETIIEAKRKVEVKKMTFEEVKEIFKKSIDTTDTMNQAIENLIQSIYLKGYNDATVYEQNNKESLRPIILYLMHKERNIPISECQKAYDVAVDYLRSQAKVMA